MMHKPYTVASMILLISGLCYAQTEQAAMTTDGRQVILKSDKTWIYLDEQPGTNPLQSALIVGDNVSEMRKLVDSLSVDLAETTAETNSEYPARLKTILSEKRLVKSDHTVYRSVIVVDHPDLSYDDGFFNLSSIDFCVAAPNGSDADRVLLVQNTDHKWTRRTGYREIRFPISVENVATARPYIRLAVYGFPVQVSEGTLFFVPTRYVVFNAKTGKRYVDFVEANLVTPR